MKNITVFSLISVFLSMTFLSCKKEDKNTLTVSQEKLEFLKEGGKSSFTIQTDASQWNISSQASWVQLNKISGNSSSAIIDVTTLENTETTTRTATIIVSAQNTQNIQISISQKGNLYPSYNTSPLAPDATGMSLTAMEIANKIKLGWNIGNTLEAIGGETNWGNPQITPEFIKLVKESGFNAVRIPCSWNQYADQNSAKIDAVWLNRVKEVVQYCVNNDLYVILNIHWDGGWLENNCIPSKQIENNAKQKAFWEQIATNLRDFDEHLLFASANEPNVEDATQMQVLLSYHQTFINAVRSTGGKNSSRVLVVQGPKTDIETTDKLMTQLPTDKILNRMMVEIHYYTPYNFTGLNKDANWGNQFYYWGKNYHSATDIAHNPTWGEEEVVNTNFGLMKKQFIDKGIPVVIGEFGAMRRDNLTGDALKLHLDSRAYYLQYVTKQANTYGLLPFYWDNGGLTNLSSGIFDRKKNSVFDQQSLDALIQGKTQ